MAQDHSHTPPDPNRPIKIKRKSRTNPHLIIFGMAGMFSHGGGAACHANDCDNVAMLEDFVWHCLQKLELGILAEQLRVRIANDPSGDPQPGILDPIGPPRKTDKTTIK